MKRRLALAMVGKGFSLVEMMVVLVIISVLAATAKPFMEVSVHRAKEAELRAALRTIRTALDSFHADCSERKMNNATMNASRHCYPLDLYVLVEGVEIASASASGPRLRRYLRAVPRDPFLTGEGDPEEHWDIRGYTDELDSNIWSGEDVYDVRVTHDRVALDGSVYSEW